MKHRFRLLIALFLTVLAPALAQSTDPVLDLRLDTRLGTVSQQRLADGTAAAQPQPIVQSGPVTPVTQVTRASSPYSYAPALLLGAVLLGLLAFSLGLLIARRRFAHLSHAASPVQLWNDTDTLEQEIGDLREQLQEQSLLNESLQTAHDNQEQQLQSLRTERDQAAGESQMLMMRQDDSDLSEAHELIDELRAEIERLRGAESDLEHDPRDLPSADDVEVLRNEIVTRDQHVAELESVMAAVRDEREELQQLLGSREAELQSAIQLVDERERELQTLQQAQQLTAEQQDQLQEQLRHLQEQVAQSAEIEQQLAASTEQLNIVQQKIEADADDIAGKQRYIEELQDRLNMRDEAGEQVASLSERNLELEQDLTTRRDELMMLAEQNDRLQARLYEFEQVLKQNEDLTAQMELGGPAATQETPVHALRAAQAQIEDLREQLDEAQERLAGDPGVDVSELERNNVKLSAMIIQRDNMVEELQQELSSLQQQNDHVPAEDWTSTVSSLENEVRRKSSLVDDHVDKLRQTEATNTQQQAQIERLSEQLESSEQEIALLRSVVDETRAMASSLREQLDEAQHVETQLRLSKNPEQDPYSQHVEAIDPIEADIETLRFTVRSREDLVSSLKAILEEESAALVAVNKRASGREEILVSLENEVAANRITIAALQNRISHAQAAGEHGVPGPQVRHLERELQRSVRVNEKLRADLHKWRQRVKPLHEAVVGRDVLIKNLRREVEAKSAAALGRITRNTGEYDETMELGTEKERDACFRIIAELWEQIEKLETDLGDTGLELSRALALDETRIQEIESLEAARGAQTLRMKELHDELLMLGAAAADTADDDNVVDLQAHRPSS